jgi:hypothetical protein
VKNEIVEYNGKTSHVHGSKWPYYQSDLIKYNSH